MKAAAGSKRAWLATAGALAALVLAACGGSDDESGGDAPEALEGEAAAEALAEAATATTTTDETVDASLDLGVTGTGIGDISLAFDALLDPATQAGEFEFATDSGDFTLLLDGDTAWITGDDPAFTAELPEGAEWVELSADELSGIGLETSFDEGGLTPQLYLALGAVDPVAEGESEINGDPVQTYSFEIDQEEAVAEAPEEAKQAVEDAVTLEGSEQTLEGEAAIDGEGFMRQMSILGTASEADLASFEISFDVEYTAFGVDVPTDPPDPETVVPLSEVPNAASVIGGALGG